MNDRGRSAARRLLRLSQEGADVLLQVRNLLLGRLLGATRCLNKIVGFLADVAEKIDPTDRGPPNDKGSGAPGVR